MYHCVPYVYSFVLLSHAIRMIQLLRFRIILAMTSDDNIHSCIIQTIANDPNGSEEMAKENGPKNRYFNIHTCKCSTPHNTLLSYNTCACTNVTVLYYI